VAQHPAGLGRPISRTKWWRSARAKQLASPFPLSPSWRPTRSESSADALVENDSVSGCVRVAGSADYGEHRVCSGTVLLKRKPRRSGASRIPRREGNVARLARTPGTRQRDTPARRRRGMEIHRRSSRGCGCIYDGSTGTALDIWHARISARRLAATRRTHPPLSRSACQDRSFRHAQAPQSSSPQAR
jgi:hypothetical protein